jgi:hypothetical protein
LPKRVFHPAMATKAATRTRPADGFFHLLEVDEAFT